VIEVPVYRRGRVVAFALVDDADLPLVAGRRWGWANGYAMSRGQFMHRVILGLKPGIGFTHHVNEIPLDNRRENLQVFPDRSSANAAPHPKRDQAARQGFVAWQERKLAAGAPA
jgi:hypothetical protein